MAGEYVRWLARDVKPAEKKELTPQEKRRNWWAYHKWYVLAAAVCLIFGADLVFDVVQSARNKPDYTIAYVGSAALPEDLARALETAIAGKGEDLNGNGKVQVELMEYRLQDASPELDYNTAMMMTVGIETADCVIYLLEEPDRFAESYPILCRTDGTAAGEDSGAPLYYLWKSCPVLTGLELGAFGLDGVEGIPEGDCQSAMANIAVARRGLWDAEPDEMTEGALRLWEVLTAGAAQ